MTMVILEILTSSGQCVIFSFGFICVLAALREHHLWCSLELVSRKDAKAAKNRSWKWPTTRLWEIWTK